MDDLDKEALKSDYKGMDDLDREALGILSWGEKDKSCELCRYPLNKGIHTICGCNPFHTE